MATEENYWQRKLRLDDERIKREKALAKMREASEKAKGEPEVVRKRPASPSKVIAEKYKNPNAPKTPSALNQLASKRAAEKVAQETAAAQRVASMQPISERAAIIRQARATTVPKPTNLPSSQVMMNGKPLPTPTAPVQEAAKKGLLRRTAGAVLNNPITRGVARVAGPTATAYQLYEAGSELVRQQDERVQRLADEETMKAERAKLVQAKGKQDTTGVGGNFARMIERGGKVPDNVKEEVPYTPASTQEQLRATDPIKQDYGMMGEISKALTDSEEGLANMGVPDMLANKRKEIESQAETALKAGTVKPEQVGNQAVINENQKRQSQGSPTTTQEEATKIKADTERTFKELGFDGQKALMTGLGLAAIAVGMKQDPRGTIQGLAEGLETRRLEGMEDTKLKGQEAARLRAEALKISENAKDRKNALDIANARIKAARDAASQKGSPKNPDITSKVAQEMVATWAEENDIEMTPDKLTSFAEQVRAHYNENPSFVGQDPSKIISSFAKPRTEKKSWGFLPWNNTQTFR